jgi:hypothetical protein
VIWSLNPLNTAWTQAWRRSTGKVDGACFFLRPGAPCPELLPRAGPAAAHGIPSLERINWLQLPCVTIVSRDRGFVSAASASTGLFPRISVPR